LVQGCHAMISCIPIGYQGDIGAFSPRGAQSIHTKVILPRGQLIQHRLLALCQTAVTKQQVSWFSSRRGVPRNTRRRLFAQFMAWANKDATDTRLPPSNKRQDAGNRAHKWASTSALMAWLGTWYIHHHLRQNCENLGPACSMGYLCESC